MNRVFGITIDLIICWFQISRLLALGVEYPHIIAGFSGAFLVTTQIKDKSFLDKMWYALGGFSFACYVAPYVCERNNCDLTSTLCLLIYFFSGVSGMGFVALLLLVFEETKTNVPKLIVTLFKFLTIKIKNLLGINETIPSEPPSGSNSDNSGGSASISDNNT